MGRLLLHLSAEYPVWYEAQQESGACRFISKMLKHCDTYSIRSEWAVITLTELMVEFGEMFSESPDRTWAVEILNHGSLPDRLKILMLSERMREKSEGMRIIGIDTATPG